jgi:uncharacterized protein (TIGR03083 family)
MTDNTALPAALRERVLAASRAARPSGVAVPEPPAISPVEALRRAADAFDAVLRSLSADEWRRTALRSLDVQALVGHLTGVEEDVQRALAFDASVADADHVSSTAEAVARQAGRAPDATRAEWRAAVDRTLSLLRSADAALLDAPLAVHGVRLPLRDLLVVRTFELWTHENDVRRATGLPPSAPDAPTLRLMTDLAVALLPHGLALAGLDLAAPVRVVLTGPGGGTWDVPPAAAPVAPADRSRVVVDAVSFCRLVANRVAPDEVAADVTGDRDAVRRLLTGAAALALD